MFIKHGKHAIYMALGANLLITLAKFIAFIVTGSSSMLAETLHSFADSGNQGLLLFGSRRSKRRATRIHQFGFGQERYFYSFMVALTIFFLGGVFAIYEGINKLSSEHKLNNPLVAVSILIISIGLESASLKSAVIESNLTRGRLGWGKFIRVSRNPELPVLLLENFAAVIGLVIALVGVSLTALTGSEIFDAVGTFLIGALLIAVAIVLGFEMKSLLIGEAATSGEERVVRENLKSTPGIISIIHMRSLYLSPEEILLAVKVAVDPGLSMSQLSDTINLAESRIRESNPLITLIYIEPDIIKEKRKTRVLKK